MDVVGVGVWEVGAGGCGRRGGGPTRGGVRREDGRIEREDWVCGGRLGAGGADRDVVGWEVVRGGAAAVGPQCGGEVAEVFVEVGTVSVMGSCAGVLLSLVRSRVTVKSSGWAVEVEVSVRESKGCAGCCCDGSGGDAIRPPASKAVGVSGSLSGVARKAADAFKAGDLERRGNCQVGGGGCRHGGAR